MPTSDPLPIGYEPKSERIRRELVGVLNQITTANGYDFTATVVPTPSVAAFDLTALTDGTIFVQAGSATLASEGDENRRHWRHEFVVTCVCAHSSASNDDLDALMLYRAAAVEREVTHEANRYLGDQAYNLEIVDIEPERDVGNAVSAVTCTFAVYYTVTRDEPFIPIT